MTRLGLKVQGSSPIPSVSRSDDDDGDEDVAYDVFENTPVMPPHALAIFVGAFLKVDNSPAPSEKHAAASVTMNAWAGDFGRQVEKMRLAAKIQPKILRDLCTVKKPRILNPGLSLKPGLNWKENLTFCG